MGVEGEIYGVAGRSCLNNIIFFLHPIITNFTHMPPLPSSSSLHLHSPLQRIRWEKSLFWTKTYSVKFILECISCVMKSLFQKVYSGKLIPQCIIYVWKDCCRNFVLKSLFHNKFHAFRKSCSRNFILKILFQNSDSYAILINWISVTLKCLSSILVNNILFDYNVSAFQIIFHLWYLKQRWKWI